MFGSLKRFFPQGSSIGKPKPGVTEGMPTSLEQGMEWQATDFFASFSQAGSPIDGTKLDYSEASLVLVEHVLDDFHRRGVALPEDLHLLASSYVFEVARRAFGGRYLRGDASNPFVLVIGPKEAEIGVCVMAKISGRAVNGPEDSIPFFYAGIAPAIATGRSMTLT